MNIPEMLEEGLNETEICLALGWSHLNLRKECKREGYALHFNYIPYSLTQEMVLMYESGEYKPKQLSKMYSLSQSMTNQVIYGEYYSTSASPYVGPVKIRELAAQGKNLQEIAEELKTSTYRVQNVVRQYNISLKKAPRLTVDQRNKLIEELKAGKGLTELAHKYGVTPGAVSHIKRHVMPEGGVRKYNRIDPELVLTLKAEGYNQQEIAEQLDVSQSSVSRILNEH